MEKLQLIIDTRKKELERIRDEAFAAVLAVLEPDQKTVLAKYLEARKDQDEFAQQIWMLREEAYQEYIKNLTGKPYDGK